MKIVKYLVIGLLALFAVNLVFKLAVGLVALVLKIAIPVALIGGAGYLVYRYATRDKALPSGRRSLP